MKTGRQIAAEKGLLPVPYGHPFSAFEAVGLPPVVACSGCGMTMSLIGPSCRVDDQDRCWCADCAELTEDYDPYLDDTLTLPVVRRILMRLDFGLYPHEVTPKEEWEILTDILAVAANANDPEITDEEKRLVLDALEDWGVMEPELPLYLYEDAAEKCWEALGLGEDSSQ